MNILFCSKNLFLECKEYQDAAYERVSFNVGFETIEKKLFRCTTSDVPLVIGGTAARSMEFPHMVNIHFS